MAQTYHIACLSLLLSLAAVSVFGQSAEVAGKKAPSDVSLWLLRLKEYERLEDLRRDLYPSLEGFAESPEKGRLLAHVASLEFLSGDRYRAASFWLAAHSCAADDAWLLDAVRALVLCGELSAAQAHLDRLLTRGRDPHSLREARFLEAQLALLLQQAGKAPAQTVSVELPHREPQALFFASRLAGVVVPGLSRYKGSPESRIFSGDGRVTLMPEPFWLLEVPLSARSSTTP